MTLITTKGALRNIRDMLWDNVTGKKLTLEKAAHLLGISPHSLKSYECKQELISEERSEHIAKVYSKLLKENTELRQYYARGVKSSDFTDSF